jgi:hypothetical protein
MDLFLSLNLLHALSALIWVAGGAVLALILLVAGRDPAAGLRAAAEAGVIGRRVLRPASTATLASGLLLAVPAGALGEAWLLLAAAMVLGSLVARPLRLEPAFAEAAAQATPTATARALGLARLDLLAQAAVGLLMILQPGWTEAAILAGLLACLVLAAALLHSLGETQLN